MDDFFEDDLYEDFDGEFETVEDNVINDGSETENDSPKDDFTIGDAFFLGTMMGFAYEEGLEERRRRKIEKETLEPDDILDSDKKEDDY